LKADGYSQKEIDSELATIIVQQGFVLQKMDRKNEALKLYADVQEKGYVSNQGALY
jgi:hypothetical protein